MENRSDLAAFENKQIRRYFDETTETWYFSVVDIIEALTDSLNPTDYLKKLRKRDVELGSYLGTNCPQVEMLTNGKKRKTLAGNVKDIFRIIQSIPSPKAEPFKQWLAKVGYERIQEMNDPEISLDRARENWKKCCNWREFSSTIKSKEKIRIVIYEQDNGLYKQYNEFKRSSLTPPPKGEFNLLPFLL